MKTIKKILDEIRDLDPDEIRDRLAALSSEEKELRKVLRLRLDAEKREGTRCKKQLPARI